jgi:hypothetical protein
MKVRAGSGDHALYRIVSSGRSPRRAPSEHTWRTLQCLESACARLLVCKELLHTSRRAHALSRHCKVLHVCPDGARLGDLPEETILYIAWSPEPDRASIGAIQVARLATLFCNDYTYRASITRNGPGGFDVAFPHVRPLHVVGPPFRVMPFSLAVITRNRRDSA